MPNLRSMTIWRLIPISNRWGNRTETKNVFGFTILAGFHITIFDFHIICKISMCIETPATLASLIALSYRSYFRVAQRPKRVVWWPTFDRSSWSWLRRSETWCRVIWEREAPWTSRRISRFSGTTSPAKLTRYVSSFWSFWNSLPNFCFWSFWSWVLT